MYQDYHHRLLNKFATEELVQVNSTALYVVLNAIMNNGLRDVGAYFNNNGPLKVLIDDFNKAAVENVKANNEEFMKVGSIVEPAKGEIQLACGGGIYDSAVVISLDPYIMVSKSADMRWSSQKQEDYTVIGEATDEQLATCMNRLKD